MNPKHLGMDAPATYLVRVEGSITARWGDWFSGLTITLHEEEGSVTSTLHGELADQAALQGLLQKLYSLGFPLLEVRLIGNSDLKGEK